MKDAILAALKTKFKGSNAVILNRIADKLAKSVTTEEAVATAVEGVTQDLIDVMESYGDSRANDAQQTAVQHYETKHGLKDGKKIEGAEPAPSAPKEKDGGDDVPAWARTLMETNKALSERIAQMDSERTTASRKQQLSAVYEKLPEALRKPYERIAVDAMSDDEFAALVGEITTEVDGLASTLNAKGGVFGRPTSASGKPTNDTPTEEQLKAVSARGSSVNAGEQPF